MAIKSIKINNLLSFDSIVINDLSTITCIVGQNNSGKSNLLKLLKFFYTKLDNKKAITPEFNSYYSSIGTITIKYDISRIQKIVTSNNKFKSNYFLHIEKTFFKKFKFNNELEITLTVNSDDSTFFSIKDSDVLSIIKNIYPFFDIDTRHIELYDWDKLWYIISRLKSFNVNDLKTDKVIEFFDKQISEESNSYSDYIHKIERVTEVSSYNYREKVLNYVKAGLKGHTFLNNGEELISQSDGTNSFRYIQVFLDLIISLTRREYIDPTVFIDEPEVGLHPKKCEELIYNLFYTYTSFIQTKPLREAGKYKTPNPKIIFSTHSPSIVKYIIKLFDKDQVILHFSKITSTKVKKMNSQFADSRFLDRFSDNEARLFFSKFILFVEGETEVEVFSNKKLLNKYPHLASIDIYQTADNSLLKNINPAYSNTSIPYLLLFDIDKVIEFSEDKSKIKIKNHSGIYHLLDKIDNELYNYLKGGFFYKENRINKKIVSKIIGLLKKDFSFDKNTMIMTNYHLYHSLIEEIAKYTKKDNVKYLKTTFEECFINENSYELFIDWLKSDYSVLCKKNKENLNTLLASLPIEKDTIIIFFRVLFEGKSNNQHKYKDIEKITDEPIKSIFSNFKLKTTNGIIKKANGWTTSFLNYSIDRIEDKVKTEISNSSENYEKEFFEKFDILFKFYFEELNDIICKTKF